MIKTATARQPQDLILTMAKPGPDQVQIMTVNFSVICFIVSI